MPTKRCEGQAWRPGAPSFLAETRSPPQVLDLSRDGLQLVAAQAEGLQRTQLQHRGGHHLEAVPAEVEHLKAARERRLGQTLGKRAGPAEPVVLSQQRA